jgi:branched-chain amino acid transport system substrate-binding protein
MRKPAAKLAAALLLTAASACAFAQSAIKIAFVMPLSGPFAVLGTSQIQGATMALEEINAKGGIKGRKLDVTTEDTGASPTTAVTALRRAMGNEPVAVVGPILGTQILAMSAEVERAATPFLVLTGTPKVTEIGNKWLFRYQVPDAIARQAISTYIIERLGKRKIALLHVNDEYGIGGTNATLEFLKSAYKLAPVAVESYGATDRDMSAQIAKVKASGAEILILQGNSGDVATVVKQLRQLKFDLPMFASNGLATPPTLALLDPADLVGIYVDSPGMPTVDSAPAIRDWTKAYQARWKVPPDIFALQEYEAVKMLAKVMEERGTDREAIRKGLSEVHYAGLLGDVWADPKGNMYHGTRIYQFGQNKTAKFVEAISVHAKP